VQIALLGEACLLDHPTELLELNQRAADMRVWWVSKGCSITCG